MSYKILLSFILTLIFLPANPWSCSGESYFEPSRYIDKTTTDEFNRLFTSYYGQEPRLNLEQVHKDYIKKIQHLEKQKNLKKSITESLTLTYDFGPIASNSYQSALNFIAASFEDDQVTGEWQDLIRLRHKILHMFQTQLRDDLLSGALFLDTEPAAQTQQEDDILKNILQLDPKQVGGYGAYLEATYYFYTGEYDKALTLYSKLKSSSKPPSIFTKVSHFFKKKPLVNWLEETAAYMEARTLLIMAQDKIDGYENDEELKEKLDLSLLNRSYDLFQTYLKDYPQGRYVDSAKNLQRKFYRLRRQREEFNKALREALNFELAKGVNSPHVHQLIREIDWEFAHQIQPTDSPILIAYAIQKILYDPKELQDMSNTLELQKDRFSAFPGLFNFLRALVLYNLEKYQDLVTIIPEPTDVKKENLILTSTEILRARALQALGDNQKALTVLKRIRYFDDDQIDLLILKTHIALKSPKDVILKDLGSERVIRAFIEGGLSDNELKALVQDNNNFSNKLQKDLKKALVTRYLVTGQLKKALEIDGPTYDHLEVIMPHIQALLTNPNNNISLLKVGKWLMDSSFHPTSLPEKLETECPECIVSIPLVPPLHYFIKIVNNSVQSKQKSMTEAEALHYLVHTCFYHGSYYPYMCKWREEYGETPEKIELQDMRENDVPVWFRKLHRVYKESPWAEKTPYYYTR